MERIQHYLIHSTLGEGSFGTVYEAVDLKSSERRVAVKLFHPHLAEIEEIKLRFFAETLNLAKLNHPGVPKLLSFGPNEKTYYLAEELVQGPTLESTISEPRPIEEAIRIVQNILEILSHAHEHDITHGGLKSSNVIVSDGGALKILSLGIEQIVNGDVSIETGKRADLYSAGAIFHELLTGTLPAVATPIAEAKPLETLRPDVPPALAAFYRRCTESQPSERWADAASALAALRAAKINAPPAPEAIVDVGGLRVRIEPFFDNPVYRSGEDPLARFLLELEVRRTEAVTAPKSSVVADIMLVLDVSGSMEASDRYPLLRRAVQELLNKIDPEDRVGIIIFSTRADMITGMMEGSEARDQARRLINLMDSSSIKFGGGTNLAPALNYAHRQLRMGPLRPDCVRRIYVLTDGELHDAKACESYLAATRQDRMEVHAYGFGSAFDAAALKRMVSDQLGGSVKPICNEEDIVYTFSHIADVNRRLVMNEGMLRIEFEPNVECGDAWSFRPQERYLGAIDDRKIIRELGGIEDRRVYSLLAEVRLPPGKDLPRTLVGKATLSWRDGEELKSTTAIIDVARAAEVEDASHPRVAQAYAILDALRNEGDRDADLKAARARLDLSRLEGRDPGLIAALEKQIAMLEGRVLPAELNSEDQQYLDADLSTNAAGLDIEENFEAYLASEARTTSDDGGPHHDDDA